jgi:hypothetical protein
MRVCYLDCHEAGLWCYLVIHVENLLRPLQLFYFICDIFTDFPCYIFINRKFIKHNSAKHSTYNSDSQRYIITKLLNTTHQTSPATPIKCTIRASISRRKYEDIQVDPNISSDLLTTYTQLRPKFRNHLDLPLKAVTSSPPPRKNTICYIYVVGCRSTRDTH